MGAADRAEFAARGIALPELARYADEPAQMRAGAPGKTGHLRAGFERRGARTELVDLASQAPYLAQRALHCDETLPDMAWLFVLSTSGCVLQGDRMTLDVTVAPGARAHVTTQSATKVHAMDANHATSVQTLTVADGGYLEYLPEPLILHRASRFASETRIVVAPDASAIVGEIVQPGRLHHRDDERFGMTVLSLATRGVRPDGTLLFDERLVVEPERQALASPAAMRDFDVFGNVFVCTPPDVAAMLVERLAADIDLPAGVACGACRLPNDAGLVFKAVAREMSALKAAVRTLWSVAREAIAGGPAPERPFWR